MITEKDNIFNWLSKTKKKKEKKMQPWKWKWNADYNANSERMNASCVLQMQVWPGTNDHVFIASYSLSLQAEKYSV